MEKNKIKETKEKQDNKCNDKKCPFHGHLKTRGKCFEGKVIKIFSTRITLEFERFIYYKKYNRYARAKTRIHAHLPKCLNVQIGDTVIVRECRPLSKIIKFVVIKKNEKFRNKSQ